MGSSASTQFHGNRGASPYPKQPHQGSQTNQSFSHAGQPQRTALATNRPADGQHVSFQAPSAGNDSSAALNHNVSRTSLDKSTMLRYVQMEKDINRLEAMNVVEHLQIKWSELKGLEEEIKRLTVIFESRKEQTLKEKMDVDEMQQPSVRSFFADQAAFDERMSREQEEYLAALNKQEVAQKELEATIGIRESVKVIVKELHVYAEQLQSMYKEQDKLLGAIFDGKYGSEREFKLEREHDASSDRQQRIAAAKARWQAGRLLVHHACAQLGHAAQQWEVAAGIPVQSMQQRYTIATEARNYLIAACANLRNSQNYLQAIEFPYCKLGEVSTVERAANNIYTDVATNERHQHAMNVFRAVFQRSGALLQWFDTVIEKTIDKDLLAATEEMFAKKRELRMERVHLIKEKLVELLGPEEAEAAGLDEDANLTDARRLHEQLSSVNQEEMQKLLSNVKVVLPETRQQEEAAAARQQQQQQQQQREDQHPDRYSVEKSSADGAAKPPKKRNQDEQQEVQDQPPPPPPPPPKVENMPKIDVVSLRDLAPPPSQEQLFGDIDSIKKQYEIDMEEYQRAQDVNRARVEQGLQEKLAARKSRKARKMAQEQETEKLLHDSAT